MPGVLSPLTRKALAAVFKDPATLLLVVAIPEAVTTAQDTADTAVTDAGTAQGAADAAQNAADAAQGDADALRLPTYVVASASAELTNERVLAGSTGLTIDLATPGVLALVLNVITALGYTPANLAGASFSGEVSLAGGVRLGVLTGSGDAAVNGYVTVLDSTGASVKLATIA
jgi:hypothetical protein